MQISPDGVDVGFCLGMGEDDETAGHLRIRSDTPCADLSSRAGLLYRVERDDIEVIRDGSGHLRQVLTPQVLADVVTVDSTEYEIRYYAADDAGDPNQTSGYYDNPTGSPFVTWVVESTDGAPNYNQLQLSKVVDSQTELVYEYSCSETTPDADWTWTLTTGESTQSTDRTETLRWQDDDPNNPSSTWTRTYTVTQDGGTYRKTIEEHSVFNWGKAVTQRSVMLDPSGDPDDPTDALITYSGYYDSGESTKGRLNWVDNPDGSWSYYTYKTDGRLASVTGPWEDYWVDLSQYTPSASSSRVVEYAYDTSGDPNDPDGPISVTTKVESTAVALTEYVYSEDPNTFDLIVDVKRCKNPTATGGARTYLTTTMMYDYDDERRVLKVEYPDSRVATYAYDDDGTFTDNGASGGSFDAGTPGTDDRVTITWGTTGSTGGVANKTTQARTVTNQLGYPVFQETYVCVTPGSSYSQIGWTLSRYDDEGHLTDVFGSNNTHVVNTWDCCGLTSTVDEMNIETTFVRDSLGRVTSRTKEGVPAVGDPNCPAQGDSTTSYSFSVSSNQRVVTATVSDDDPNTANLQTESKSDLAGRIVRQEDPAGLVAQYSYDATGQGGRKVTVTHPGGGTEITEYYRDGRIKKVSGTAVVSRYYEYDKVADGDQWTWVYTGSTDDTSARWIKTTQDPLGRTKLEERPAFVPSGGGENTVTTTYTYDSSTGRLSKVQSADTSGDLQAGTVYEYDSDTGRLFRTGLDLNDDGDLDTGGTDRINETVTDYVSQDSAWWLRTKKYVYLTDNSSTATRISTERQRLTAHGASVIRETKVNDVFNNVTVITTTLDPNLPLVTGTTDFPAADNSGERVTYNGLLQSVKDKAQVTTAYGYDGFGRRITVTDGRGNTTTTAYNAYGQVDYVDDPNDNRTSYAYFDPNDAGRLKSVKNDSDKYTYYDYDTHGQVTHVWGDVPHPVQYEYDSTFGQRTKVHTYQEGSGWTGQSWPGSPGTADTTEYTYDEATGLLTERKDALSKSVNYEYTPDGKLKVRTWARKPGGSDLTTTYRYYAGSTGSGDPNQIDYSDSTPDVAFTYKRDGQLASVADAVGTRTFSYDTKGLRQYEIFDPNSLYGDRRIYTDYSYQIAYGDPVGWPPSQPTYNFGGLASLGVGPSAAQKYADYRVDYTYDGETDHVEKVSGDVVTTDGVEYSYLSGSHLISQIDYKNGANTLASVVYGYHADRDLPTDIKNVWGSNPNDPNAIVSRYTYAYDGLWRPTSVIRRSATKYGVFANDHHDAFSYDDRNDLTQSKRYNNTSPGTTSNPDTAYDRVFTYDTYGSRDTYKLGTDPTTDYATDERNLYDSTEDPNEAFTYDYDHNLTEDGSFEYAYDAENRLIRVEPAEDDPNQLTADDKKIEYAYDYLSRRVRKAVYAWDPNAADWSATAELDLRFMYHERKLLLELDGLDSLAKVRKHVWGPGPSPKRERGAVLGHLLAVGDVSGSTDYVCFTNAGGSVVQLLDRSDGSIDAKYVYDVNGDTVSKSGTYADDNPLRYRAMYFDKELDYADTACDGLYCTPAGSYYSPRLGRAVTRGAGGGRVPGGFAGNVGGALPYGGNQFHMPLIGGGDVHVSPGCGEGGCANIDPQDPCENPQTAEDCERCNPPCAEAGFEYAIVNGRCICVQREEEEGEDEEEEEAPEDCWEQWQQNDDATQMAYYHCIRGSFFEFMRDHRCPERCRNCTDSDYENCTECHEGKP